VDPFPPLTGRPYADAVVDIRQATSADLDEVRRVVEAAYTPWIDVIGIRPMPMDEDSAALVGAGKVQVVEAEGAVAAVLIVERDADHLLIENLAVDPAVQGRGLGARLLGLVEDEARAQGLPEVRLYTHVLMASNIAWYENHGFVETSRDGTLPRRRVWRSKTM